MFVKLKSKIKLPVSRILLPKLLKYTSNVSQEISRFENIKHESIYRSHGRNPPEKLKNRVSLQYWSGSPENHKATKPALNDSILGHHRPASETPFPWRADGGSFIAVFGSSLPSQKNNNNKKTFVIAPLEKLSGSAHVDTGSDNTG